MMREKTFFFLFSFTKNEHNKVNDGVSCNRDKECALSLTKSGGRRENFMRALKMGRKNFFSFFLSNDIHSLINMASLDFIRDIFVSLASLLLLHTKFYTCVVQKLIQKRQKITLKAENKTYEISFKMLIPYIFPFLCSLSF